MENQHNYDTKFFIKLAKEGKDAWNKWRHSEPQKEDENYKFNSQVIFDGGGEELKLQLEDFEGFEFGHGAQFENITFSRSPRFTGSSFGKNTVFTNCYFYNSVEFMKCTFEHVTFHRCRFEISDFEGSTITESIILSECEFFRPAIFRTTTIKNLCCEDTAFCDSVEFNDTTFIGDCLFSATSFRSLFIGMEVQNNNELVPAKLKLPSFLDCNFIGEVNTSGRSLDTSFSGSTFNFIPNFSRSIDAQKMNLDDIKLHVSFEIFDRKFPKASEFGQVLQSIRALKKISTEQLHSTIENELGILERKFERAIAFDSFKSPEGRLVWNRILANPRKLFKNLLFFFADFFYEVISNYGKSLFRPPLIWFVSLVLFANVYNRIMFKNVWFHALEIAKTLKQDQIVSPETYNRIAQTSNLANNLPIVGQLALDSDMKKVLFCGYIPKQSEICIPPQFYDSTLVIQNIFVGLLIFLFGLAIRNYFKIK